MKKVCVIGYPAKHSLSPKLHGYWLNLYNIDGSYEALEINPEEFKARFRNLHSEGFVGCNVTVPFKEEVFKIVDEIDDFAKSIGAVNTVVIKDGKYIGSNTDAYGFIQNIKSTKTDFDFTKGAAVILGAGGAARAVVAGLIAENVPEIIIINRSIDKAEKIKHDIEKTFGKQNIRIVSWEKRNEVLSNANLLVNTTVLGMNGQAELDISLDTLPKEALVNDIVYRPLITKLLQEAEARGNIIVDGLGMLLHQAVPGFELWFGKRSEVTEGQRNSILFEIDEI